MIYLVRHAENKQERDGSLTLFGLKQASWVGSQLPHSIPLIASPYQRTMQTAEIISGLVGSNVVYDYRLTERFDISESKKLGFSKYKQLIDKSNKDKDFVLPNGKTTVTKGREVFELIKEYSQNPSAIFVTHAGTILDFCRTIYENFHVKAWESFRTPYASITVIEWDKQIINSQIFCPFAKTYVRN